MIVLTRDAIAAIEQSMAREGKIGSGLRIAIESGGCSGHKYSMQFEDEPRENDTVIEIRDVKVFVDPDSAPLLVGTTVDFSSSLEGSGFVFDNPNAGEKCSCGKSFG